MKLHISPETEQSLREVISQDDLSKFDELASPLKWGKPSWSVSQLLLQVLHNDENKLWLWGRSLADHKNPFTRRYAPGILFELWEKDATKVARILSTLSDDENWIVREHAHSYWGELLKKDFRHVLPILQKWSTHSSANLRRCVAIAARTAGNKRNEEWAKPLIDLLESLLPDKTPYVRKNLGSYAIGDGLLRCYPEFTLGYLRKWAHAKDEGTRWNVAMAFASYGGNKNWRESLKVLESMAVDKRRFVWRAVATALIYLARRHPEIRITLKKWASDPERASVAGTTLKYIGTGKAHR